MPNVSIIINTWNRRASLLATIGSVLDQEGAPPYEVIVVDDGSTDGTPEALEDLVRQGKIRILATRRLGSAGTRNRGFDLARGELLTTMDNDVICMRDWLRTVVDVFEKDPSIGIVGAWGLRGAWLPHAELLRGMGSYTGRALEDIHAVSGHAMTFRREVLRRIGRLDDQMFLYWEDTDFCWRAVLAGFRVVSLNEVLTFHMKERSAVSRPLARQLAYEAMKNKILTHLKCAPAGMAARFLAYELLRSVKRTLLCPTIEPSIWRAWLWNLRHLGGTAWSRREIYSQGSGRARRLLDLIRKDQEDDRRFVRYEQEVERRIACAAAATEAMG